MQRQTSNTKILNTRDDLATEGQGRSSRGRHKSAGKVNSKCTHTRATRATLNKLKLRWDHTPGNSRHDSPALPHSPIKKNSQQPTALRKQSCHRLYRENDQSRTRTHLSLKINKSVHRSIAVQTFPSTCQTNPQGETSRHTVGALPTGWAGSISPVSPRGGLRQVLPQPAASPFFFRGPVQKHALPAVKTHT